MGRKVRFPDEIVDAFNSRADGLQSLREAVTARLLVAIGSNLKTVFPDLSF